ncbi:MAG: GDP-L-fucose synthase [Balneolaceae bacterium]|nr:MAG: GDP-L-fucose synthase [Balneolaceae bacterium]
MNVKKTDKIYIAGHKGMVGSAIYRLLKHRGYNNLLVRTRNELDLRNQGEVVHFMSSEKPKAVIIAAAKVGGILANNQYPYQFLRDNLIIQDNLINSAFENGVKKLIFLGSSCIYPKFAQQPMSEDSLLTGELEPTNQWYAIAKIAGVKQCEAIKKQFGRDYVSLMPTNLYGPGDNFDLETSHVLPAMIRKFHDAKEDNHAPVRLWGSGSPKREFLYVDDVADAVEFALTRELSSNLYNVGSGIDLFIKELAEKIREMVGHKGEVLWDADKPDGTPRKLMDVSKLKAEGWEYSVKLEDGIEQTYNWFRSNLDNIREVKFD